MKNDDINKLRKEAFIPHLAREIRRQKGYLSGDLVCQICGATNASKNRQRTAYVNSDNTAILCPKCQKEADEYWDNMWDEYYSSQGV